MKRHLVIAPHPDDETLGCGGTILRDREAGEDIYWLIVTGISEEEGFTTERVRIRASEIKQVSAPYGFKETVQLKYPTAKLDTVPMSYLVSAIGDIAARIRPTDIYLPHRRDAHSNHAAVFDASISITKWFRYGSVERVFVYETQSETDFDVSTDSFSFRPNVSVDVSETIEKKIEIARMFDSEFSSHSFPRSFDGIRALALLRDAAASFVAAEAFMLPRQRITREGN